MRRTFFYLIHLVNSFYSTVSFIPPSSSSHHLLPSLLTGDISLRPTSYSNFPFPLLFSSLIVVLRVVVFSVLLHTSLSVAILSLIIVVHNYKLSSIPLLPLVSLKYHDQTLLQKSYSLHHLFSTTRFTHTLVLSYNTNFFFWYPVPSHTSPFSSPPNPHSPPTSHISYPVYILIRDSVYFNYLLTCTIFPTLFLCTPPHISLSTYVLMQYSCYDAGRVTT